MKHILTLAAVLVAITVTSQTAQASSDGLTWSYGNYATSKYLRMAPAHVMRTEDGYIVVPIAVPIPNNRYKTMGEGEAPMRKIMPLLPSRPAVYTHHWNIQEL